MDDAPSPPPPPPSRGRRYARRAADDGRQLADDAYRRADGVYRRADEAVSGGERHAFRFLWLFLPEPAIARTVRFQHLMASVFLADAARDAVDGVLGVVRTEVRS